MSEGGILREGKCRGGGMAGKCPGRWGGGEFRDNDNLPSV